MKPLRNLLVSVTLSLFAGAAAGNVSPFPHWQLVAIEPGGHNQVRFIPVRPVDLNNPPRLSLPGAELTSLSFDRDSGEISFMVAGEPGTSLSFDSVLLDYGEGPEKLQLGPVQIIWLNRPEPSPLLISARLAFNAPDSVMEVGVTNNGTVALELTDFHYAPRAVATGRLQLAEGNGLDTSLLGLHVPGVTYGAPPLPSGTQSEASALLPFSFAERSLSLEPGEQVVLVLRGDGFIEPALFDNRLLFEFGPVYEYRSAGETYHVTFTRHFYDWEPGEREADR